jgi:transcriptional regulator CtsR
VARLAQLSDTIERFIKDLMEQEAHIDLKRNELAQHFGCAPSQINYVLATRFSIDHGYVIESRRGGGGYVRIVRMRESAGENLLSSLIKRVGSAIEEDAAAAIIAYLLERGIITQREGRLMRAATRHTALALPVNAKDVLRASILRNMLIQAFRNYEGGDGHDV